MTEKLKLPPHIHYHISVKCSQIASEILIQRKASLDPEKIKGRSIDDHMNSGSKKEWRPLPEDFYKKQAEKNKKNDIITFWGKGKKWI